MSRTLIFLSSQMVTMTKKVPPGRKGKAKMRLVEKKHRMTKTMEIQSLRYVFIRHLKCKASHYFLLEDDIALEPNFCWEFSDVTPACGPARCRHFQDLLVFQVTTQSTIKKSQKYI